MEFIVTDLPFPELWEGAAVVPLFSSPPFSCLPFSSLFLPLPSLPFFLFPNADPKPGADYESHPGANNARSVQRFFNVLYFTNRPPEGLRVQLLYGWRELPEEKSGEFKSRKAGLETHGQLRSSRWGFRLSGTSRLTRPRTGTPVCVSMTAWFW